jgi:hypothetical protein
MFWNMMGCFLEYVLEYFFEYCWVCLEYLFGIVVFYNILSLFARVLLASGLKSLASGFTALNFAPPASGFKFHFSY